jgi:hypothetical protein
MSYSHWLRSIVDLKDKHSAEVVRFVSDFDALAYKSCPLLVQYARYWCLIADFLYENRTKQLSSDVEILFVVAERNEKTNIYWFEVARACDMAGKEAIQTLVQWLGIIPVVDAKTGYAEAGLGLSQKTLNNALDLVKEVVGLCHYTLVVAGETCKYFDRAPELMQSIKRRHLNLRVIGCWIAGMLELQFPPEIRVSETTAYDLFEVCSDLAALGKDELYFQSSAPLADSCAILKSYAFVLKSISDGNKGYAKGFAKQCAKHVKTNPALVARIEAMTRFDGVAPAPVVPSENSPLLKILNVNKPAAPLMKGLNPLTGLPKLRLLVTQ